MAFCGFVVAFLVSFDVACADPCQAILEEFKTLSDRANREVESTVANLREAVSEVRDDKTRIELIARSCVAAAEALGVFKSYRIAVSGCMGEQASRSVECSRCARPINQPTARITRQSVPVIALSTRQDPLRATYRHARSHASAQANGGSSVPLQATRAGPVLAGCAT